MRDPDIFPAEPEKGRVFRRTRAVRIGDTTASGRLRLDALARYLQDVGNDDTLDLGVGDGGAWVCRRIEIATETGFPQLRDEVTLSTFCGGAGSRWAERRTDVAVPDGAQVATATLWVHLDPETMRPAPVPTWFTDLVADTWGERKPDHRLYLPAPPADATTQPFPLRTTDFDILDHVNNAIAFAALEEAWAASGIVGDPQRVTVEYLGALDHGDDVVLQWTARENGIAAWLSVGDDVRVAATMTTSGAISG